MDQRQSHLNGTIDRAIIALMKRASITEARNNLSALIDGLKGGSGVLIVDRGRAVARLEPVAAPGDYGRDAGRLTRLIRAGIARPGRARVPKDILDTRPPSARAGASAVHAILDERREGR